MNTAVLIQSNGKVAPPPTANWLSSTVREFFTSFNWEDHPPEVQELRQNVILNQDTTLSMELSVAQFFGAIPWDGVPVSAPALAELLQSEPEQSAVDNFTLDDFSSLF